MQWRINRHAQVINFSCEMAISGVETIISEDVFTPVYVTSGDIPSHPIAP
jgi:hypothetical protein